MALPPPTLTVGANGTSTTFTLDSDTLTVLRSGDKKRPRIETAVRNVLWAELTDGILEISFLARRKPKLQYSLVHVTGNVQQDQRALASAFSATLMDAAYAGIKRQRRLRVFVNPKSGPGNGIPIYLKVVEPIFQAARCTIETTITTHSQHAQELTKQLELDQFDAVVALSGDGLVHEVINGFAEHADPDGAFRIPIAPVPGGSGNGTALNILGIQDGLDVRAAALNAVKGQLLRMDLCSVTQNGKTSYSFMTQVVGLFADLDIGTEFMRFLGSSRFVIGYIYHTLRRKECPIKLSIKVVETDKRKMVDDLHAYQAQKKAQASEGPSQTPVSSWKSGDADATSLGAPSTLAPSPLPNTKALSTPTAPDGDGWITFDKPLSYMYAGKAPYVSRDFMQFPVAKPDDGIVDVVVQEITTRKEMINAMDGSDCGKQYWLSSQRYFKATAYRVEPCASKGCVSIDGEEYPFEPFTVECHRQMATILSPCGYYLVDFPRPSDVPPR